MDNDDVSRACKNMKELWEYDPNSKEYADLSYDEVCILAYGFCENDIKKIHPSVLNVKWHHDMLNPIEQIKKYPGSKEDWARSVDLSEGIELSYEDGKLYVEDGHHRFTAARILNKTLNVCGVVFNNNPHPYSLSRKISAAQLREKASRHIDFN